MREAPEEALEIRNDLGIDPDGTVFLFAGKLEPKSSPLNWQKPLRRLDAQAPFDLCGIRRARNSTEKSDSTQPNIHFVGFQNQSKMPDLVSGCGCLLFAFRGPGETWGLAVNEALACGCRVIVSDRVGCAEDLIYSQKMVLPSLTPEDHSNWPAAMQLIAERIQSPSFDRGDLMQHVTPFNFAAFASAIKKHIHE